MMITEGNWGLQLNCLGGKNDSLSSCIVIMLKLSQWQPLLSVCNSAYSAKNILIHHQKELNEIVPKQVDA